MAKLVRSVNGTALLNEVGTMSRKENA